MFYVLRNIFWILVSSLHYGLSLNSYAQECGISHGRISVANCSHTSQAIKGGEDAKLKTWPWQAMLFIELINGSEVRCGASILYPKYLVTSAHCKYAGDFSDIRYQRVYAGFLTWPIFLDEVPPTLQKRNVKKFTKHKDHDKKGFNQHDIAIIELEDPFEFSDAINSVCLPTDDDVAPVNSDCYTAGYGLTEDSLNCYMNQLKEICLPIMDHTACAGEFTQAIVETMICAGGMATTNGLRKGDSGGGLVCKINNVWKIFGVASFSYTDLTIPKPSGFAIIKIDLEFINNYTILNDQMDQII